MLPINEVQATIVATLTAALSPVPVFDYQQNQAYPYVTVGESTGGDDDGLTNAAVDMEIAVHIWSRQPGMKEVAALMSRAHDALHRQRFAVAGFQWVDTQLEQFLTLRDPDGVTRHGVLKFRVLTYQPS